MPSIFTLEGPKLDGQRGVNFQPQTISSHPALNGQGPMNFQPRIISSHPRMLSDAASTGDTLLNVFAGLGIAAIGIATWKHFRR